VRSLAPCALVLAGWALAYVAGGFGSTHSGYYQEPLADPTLRWVVWNDGEYAAWTPPSPSVTVELAAPRSIFDSSSRQSAG
jgi:hypothetical protein